jgi:hypothetical protein
MKHIPLTSMALAVSAAFVLTACGGGGDSPASTATPVVLVPTAVPVVPPAGGNNVSTLTGTVATGSAVKGAKVEIKDAKGATATANTDANGVYTIDTSKLTAPFLIKASGGTLAVTGKANSTDLYSISVMGEKTANVTLLTKLVFAKLANQLPEDGFAKADGSLNSKLADKTSLNSAIEATTKYVAQNMGVDAQTLGNVITSKLDATVAGDPHDALLEKLLEKDPNFANKAIELLKDNGIKINIDPAKETLGQCIASLSLASDSKLSNSAEEDVAVYTWDGHKKVDWSGQQKFVEGWFGGVYKDYFGANAKQVALDGEQVLQTSNEYIVQEDLTDSATNNKYPFTVKAKEYRTLDRKKVLGWRDDYFNQSDVATGEWMQKNNLASAARYNQLFDVVQGQAQNDSYSRKAAASWRAEVYTEDLKTEYRFLGREIIDTKLGKIETCVSLETTNLVQKNTSGTPLLKQTWSAKHWRIPKLGYAKYETNDLETDVNGKVFLEEKHTYDIVGARKNGQRYGSYDLWTGVLTGQKSASTGVCSSNITGETVGFSWLVKPEANGKGMYRTWNGTQLIDLAINYSGVNLLNNFRSEAFDNRIGTGKMSWSQNMTFNLSDMTLSGTYIRTDEYTKPSVCKAVYPYLAKGSKVF